jgi:hypothetical protein
MFLQHESTREKVGFNAEFVAARSHNLHLQLMPGCQQALTGLNVGKSSISGAMSALKKYQLNHTYGAGPDAYADKTYTVLHPTSYTVYH